MHCECVQLGPRCRYCVLAEQQARQNLLSWAGAMQHDKAVKQNSLCLCVMCGKEHNGEHLTVNGVCYDTKQEYKKTKLLLLCT